MDEPAKRVFLTTFTLLWASLIYLLSSQPASNLQGAENFFSFLPGADYFAHGLLYFVLASLIFFTMRMFLPDRGWVLGIDTVVLTLLYGISDEWHQSFVAGRTASALDLAADLVAAICAVTIWLTVVWLRSDRHWRRKLGIRRFRPPWR